MRRFALQSCRVVVQMGRRAREPHCASPLATTESTRNGRGQARRLAAVGGCGGEFMLYCIFDKETKKYARCGPTTKGREQDSRVHRFDRVTRILAWMLMKWTCPSRLTLVLALLLHLWLQSQLAKVVQLGVQQQRPSLWTRASACPCLTTTSAA